MSQAGLYYRTIRHLTPNQIWRLATKRLRPPLTSSGNGKRRPAPSLKPADRRHLLPEARRQEHLAMLGANRFTFLNQTVDCSAGLPWEKESLPQLWKLHLHYFDYADASFSEPGELALLERLMAVARDWVARNKLGQGTGWMPYAVSLRAVNWLKFLVRNPDHAAQPETAFMLESLWVQTDFLARNLEFEFGANHLLKNAKTLVFAGALLDAPEADGWQAKGEEILGREIRRQILTDGGHYERSPMYHLQVLEDLLDLQALGRATACALSISELLEERIASMACFTRSILHPDGEIPLFNDSALGSARPARELLTLAEAWPSRETVSAARATVGASLDSPDLTLLADTGYAVIRDRPSNSCLIFDCGPLGPDSNPAHGHCDVLSYELSLFGHRVETDTGVSTYERGPERDYERSTAALAGTVKAGIMAHALTRSWCDACRNRLGDRPTLSVKWLVKEPTLP